MLARSPRLEIRSRLVLVLLILATTLPLAIFGAWAVSSSWDQRHALVDQQNVEQARMVSVAVDEEVGRTLASLGVLALLEPIETPDKSHFTEIAARTLPLHPGWTSIRLVTRDHQIVADTEQSAGRSTLIQPDWVDRIFETRLPAVSNVRQDPVSGIWFVSIGVPVIRKDTVLFALGVRVRASSFSELLRRQNPPPGGLITLLDEKPAIIARTLNEERFVGRTPSNDFVERARAAREGAWRSVTLEGVPSYASWSRSSLTGWTVGNAMPASAVEGPMRQSLRALLVTGTLTLGAGVLLSVFLTRALVRLERERSARQAAEALNRSKDAFVATVSHELRTPLNAIMGWATLLRAGALTSEQQAHAQEVILRNTRVQTQLIEDLLEMSRIVRGSVKLDLEPLDLVSVIGHAVEVMTPAAESRRVQLSLAPVAEPLVVMGDRGRLQQVFWNLLSNALKFTAEGGRVDVSVGVEDHHARVTVADTGEGIDGAFMPFVFDRFRQETPDVTRANSGLGIGLSVVRDLIELHGGRVAASSDGKGRGATFTVTLPLATTSGPDLPASPSPPA